MQYVPLSLLLPNCGGDIGTPKGSQLSSAAEIASELEAFYKGYVDAVNREDIDALTELFAFPWALVSSDGGARPSSTMRRIINASCASSCSTSGRADGVRGGIDRFTAWASAMDDLAMVPD